MEYKKLKNDECIVYLYKISQKYIKKINLYLKNEPFLKIILLKIISKKKMRYGI